MNGKNIYYYVFFISLLPSSQNIIVGEAVIIGASSGAFLLLLTATVIIVAVCCFVRVRRTINKKINANRSLELRSVPSLTSVLGIGIALIFSLKNLLYHY